MSRTFDLVKWTLALGSGAPGTVLPGPGLVVACGTGALRLERLQRPGGRALAAEAFLRGFALPESGRLPLSGIASIGAR